MHIHEHDSADTTPDTIATTTTPAADDSADEARVFDHSGTYSPEDNKLRLYPAYRLPPELYERVKEAGFSWAPKQELFVAPMWTPARHDLLLELCGEIDNEDISLEERAIERAERFAGYHGSRTRDAHAAHAAVAAIAGRFELGQPILVGHHSERRARKDKERIENGMRRAVSMWETAEYWKERAAGVVGHAEYKARPDVRARRIKKLEAEERKQLKNIAEAEKYLAAWKLDNLTLKQAKYIAGAYNMNFCFTLDKYPREAPKSQYEGSKSLWSALEDEIITVQQARELAINALTRRLSSRRWLEHFQNRLVYERAMLGEQGGLPADKFAIEVGGQVLVRGSWQVVKRITRKEGRIVSVSTDCRYVRVRQVEEIKDYRAPSAEVAAAAQEAAKRAPLVNYPGEGFGVITSEEWDKIPKDYKTSREIAATATAGRHRVRVAMGAFAHPNEKDMNKRHGYHFVYLSDKKRTDPPAPAAVAAPASAAPAPEPVEAPRAVYQPPEKNDFDKMREQLKTGIQVVSAPQLFPTPRDLAARMVELADLSRGMCLLEPSAGTGALLAAVREATGGGVIRTAVEISARLCDALRIREEGAAIINRDFLECGEELGQFDAVLMNPPFADAQDIAHILHAKKYLKPGGVLVAICANGPRQNNVLRPMIEQNRGLWEVLPSGTFQSSGTMVSTVLMVYRYHQ